MSGGWEGGQWSGMVLPIPSPLLLLFSLLTKPSPQRRRAQRGSCGNYAVFGMIIVLLILQGNHAAPPLVGAASRALSQRAVLQGDVWPCKSVQKR